jgi:AraC-like DNA-binding protein
MPMDRRGLQLSNANRGIAVWRPAGFDGIVLYRGTEVSHAYPRHWHDELHVCAYVAGAGHLFLRGSSYRIVPGDFVVTPAGEVHENWVDEGTSISFRSAYLDITALRSLVEESDGRGSSLLDFSEVLFQDRPVLHRFQQMHRALEGGASRLCQDELLLDFMRCLVMRCSCNPPGQQKLGNEGPAVDRIRRYIQDNFARPIALSDLGRIANLSSFHLHRVFCRQIGMPPHAYQTQVRINRAKELVRKRWPLSEIALATGFADQSHLTRHFRRLVGITPGRYCQ